MKEITRVILVGFTKPDKSRKPDVTRPKGVSSTDVPENKLPDNMLRRVGMVYYHGGLPGPVKSQLIHLFVYGKLQEIQTVEALKVKMRRQIPELAQAVGDYLIPYSEPLTDLFSPGLRMLTRGDKSTWNAPVTRYNRYYDRHY